MTRDDIQTRLTFWYTSVLAVALIVFSLTTWFLLYRIVRSDLVSSLVNQSSGLSTYLQIEDSDPSIHLPNETDEYSRSLPQKHLLTVLNDANQVVYANWDGIGQALSKRENPSGVPFALSYHDEPYLAVFRSVKLRTGHFQTFLAIPQDPSGKAVRSLGTVLLCLIPLFIAAGILGGYWLSRKALAPVGKITERARSIGIHDLSERLPSLHTHDELQLLTETWNGMLDRIEQSVTKIAQFTADASHELRTPVAIIRLAAENALRRDRSADQYREALARIRQESENMTTLIEDLLFLARADAKLSETSLELVAIGPLIEAASKDFADAAETKHIRITLEISAGAPLVLGNASAVHRVLRILLDNAVKYTPNHGSIRLELAEQDDKLVLRVIDSGLGIPDDLHDRIFERFYRVDTSRSKESGGYGLGLAIAAAIVSQYQATIAVERNAEGGSTFSLFLPVAA